MNIRAASAKERKGGEGETKWRAAQGLEARIKRRKKRNVETR